jgi:hypothetical protein
MDGFIPFATEWKQRKRELIQDGRCPQAQLLTDLDTTATSEAGSGHTARHEVSSHLRERCALNHIIEAISKTQGLEGEFDVEETVGSSLPKSSFVQMIPAPNGC